MFNSLQQQPADKILALMQIYKEDPRENKIDLGVGVYKDASGQTPIMQSIKQAEHMLWETQDTKSYVGLTGAPEFSQTMIDLVLGDNFDKNFVDIKTFETFTTKIENLLKNMIISDIDDFNNDKKNSLL